MSSRRELTPQKNYKTTGPETQEFYPLIILPIIEVFPYSYFMKLGDFDKIRAGGRNEETPEPFRQVQVNNIRIELWQNDEALHQSSGYHLYFPDAELDKREIPFDTPEDALHWFQRACELAVQSKEVNELSDKLADETSAERRG